MRKVLLILFATIIVAISLANAGCVGTLRNILVPSPSPIPTPTVTAGPAVALPSSTPTAVPTPISTVVPGNVDIIFTPPPEAGYNQSTPIQNLTGTITVNGKPAVGYEVLIVTAPGFEYGNFTRSDGGFIVRFRQDNSSTFLMKLDNAQDILIYQDKVPRPMSYTGPMTITITIPSTNIESINITPTYTGGNNITI